MLKSKKIIYLLIMLVAVIWGLIFYKIYSNFGGKKQAEKNFTPSVAIVENVQVDSIFTLLLDYPDPFLKGAEQSSESSILAAVKITNSPPVVNWPSIEYRGLLTRSGKNESTGLLKVQNSNLLVKEGKVYSTVRIRTITRDSIFLEYHNESRWLRIIK